MFDLLLVLKSYDSKCHIVLKAKEREEKRDKILFSDDAIVKSFLFPSNSGNPFGVALKALKITE